MTDDALRDYELAVWEALAGARPAPPRPGGPAPDTLRTDLERIWTASARRPGGADPATRSGAPPPQGASDS